MGPHGGVAGTFSRAAGRPDCSFMCKNGMRAVNHQSCFLCLSKFIYWQIEFVIVMIDFLQISPKVIQQLSSSFLHKKTNLLQTSDLVLNI